MDLWILTEERPKKNVISQIVTKLCNDKKIKFVEKDILFKPIFDGKNFSFVYVVEGITINKINKILIKIVSGGSSFVDFLIYFLNHQPTPRDIPIYAIEETKTSDSESRNTGVFQRCSKFVYITLHYPNCKKIMLYNIRVNDNGKPTKTNIFGTRMLITLGVEIMGKNLDPKLFHKFESIDEFIKFKNDMRAPPAGNVPINLKKFNDKITVSGRLYKSGGLSHDPNIGALSIISETLRFLGWKKDIVITLHGLSQSNLGRTNKFIRIANELDIKLDGLVLPKTILPDDYWHYDINSEKNGTIFLHLILMEVENISIIYENHAGCERGYFFDKDNTPIVIHKYIENNKSNGIIHIPDLIICNHKTNEIYNYEGKTYANRINGVNEIENFDAIETEYLKRYYPNYKIIRGVVLYGSDSEVLDNDKIIFLLNKDGKIILNNNTPDIIKETIQKHLKSNN
jgi:hypothetical protein